MAEIKIIELPAFVKEAGKILSENERQKLHEHLSNNPYAGNLIKGGGGARKLRWAAGGKGKQGGARVLYSYLLIADKIHLARCYKKSKMKDISPQEKKKLKSEIKNIKRGK